MLDPASDSIFNAVKFVSTRQGTVEQVPKTDEDWDRIRIGAVTLAEGAYLLKIPRPFAPDGDQNNMPGPVRPNYRPLRSRRNLTQTRCSGTRKSRRCETLDSR